MRLPLSLGPPWSLVGSTATSALSNLRESLLSWPRRMRPSYVNSSACLSINSNHRQPRASAA